MISPSSPAAPLAALVALVACVATAGCHLEAGGLSDQTSLGPSFDSGGGAVAFDTRPGDDTRFDDTDFRWDDGELRFDGSWCGGYPNRRGTCGSWFKADATTPGCAQDRDCVANPHGHVLCERE